MRAKNAAETSPRRRIAAPIRNHQVIQTGGVTRIRRGTRVSLHAPSALRPRTLIE
jgi:hypothetical protein